MKNVLFASTALVAFGFAGASFADGHASTSITLSGSAELGFTSRDADTSATDDGHIQVHNDFDLTWALVGTTDGGLEFGASGDWDEAPTEEKAHAYISGSFGTITIGDTDGAFDKAMIEIASGGLVDETDFYVNGNSGFDGTQDAEDQVARYDIAFGGTTLSVSYEDGDDSVGSENVYGIGAAFTFGTVSMGIGYQEAGDDDIAGISASVALGSVDLTANYSAGETGGNDMDAYGVSAEIALGAGTLAVNYDYDEVDGVSENTGYGIWYSMPLGGGATFTAAAGTDEDIAGNEDTQFGAGIGMSF